MRPWQWLLCAEGIKIIQFVLISEVQACGMLDSASTPTSIFLLFSFFPPTLYYAVIL